MVLPLKQNDAGPTQGPAMPRAESQMKRKILSFLSFFRPTKWWRAYKSAKRANEAARVLLESRKAIDNTLDELTKIYIEAHKKMVNEKIGK